MLQALKKKTMIRALGPMIVLVALLIGGLVKFGPDYVNWVQGPTYFEPMESNDISALRGSYLEADVDTLLDYYAQTVRKEDGKPGKVSSCEYVMPVNTMDDRTIYIGLKVSGELISDADDVVDDTIRMLHDEDGSYEWDGSSVSVCGTVELMDQKTQNIYREYLNEAGIEDEEIGLGSECYFLPLVLTDKEIGGFSKNELLLIAGVGCLFLIAVIRILYLALSGSYQSQIRDYIKAAPNPELMEQQLNQFYESTQSNEPVRMNHNGLLYVRGMDSWFLAADDIVWAYQYELRRKSYGIITVSKEIDVKVYSASEGEKERCHIIRVKNEEEAQEILARLEQTFPNAVFGYTDELWNEYQADPKAFHQMVVEVRSQSAERETAATAETTEE